MRLNIEFDLPFSTSYSPPYILWYSNMKRVPDPFADIALPLDQEAFTVLVLKAIDPDVLLDAALAVKNTLPVELVPEVGPLRHDLRNNLWVVRILTHRRPPHV
jgi:hypothetical protein